MKQIKFDRLFKIEIEAVSENSTNSIALRWVDLHPRRGEIMKPVK